MLEFDAERVRANVSAATTEDLLDRATVYREGMEPEALDIIEAELRRRGVTPEQIEARARHHDEQAAPAGSGPPPRCSFCNRPAVGRRWGWEVVHWRGFLPLPALPHRYYYCAEHGGRHAPSSAEGPRRNG
jgi:hypothetical protein